MLHRSLSVLLFPLYSFACKFSQKAKTKERMGVKATREDVIAELTAKMIAELTAKEQVKTVMEDPIPELTLKQEQQQKVIIRELRDLPPSHYLFKIKNFSQLSIAKVENYQSSDFEVGGYKWRLSLYPEGNKKVNENDHISLYLVLSDSNTVPFRQGVNAFFKLFVYNQIQDKYLAVDEDGKDRIRHFRGMKTEWGFDQFISLAAFNDASNGYLVDDCCVFGAEIFVMERIDKGECVSIVKELANSTYTWNVQNFAQHNLENYDSQVFVIGEHKWYLSLYPNGNGTAKGKSLSMFLWLKDSETLASGQKVYVDYLFRIRDQVSGKHYEKTGHNQFCNSTNNWGFSNFIPLSELKDASKGFIVDNTMIVEVQILLMTIVKEFS